MPPPNEREPRRDEWPAVLRKLTAQLDAGRSYRRDLPDLYRRDLPDLYRRDLPDLSPALDDLIAAYNRRQRSRPHRL